MTTYKEMKLGLDDGEILNILQDEAEQADLINDERKCDQ